MTFAALPKYPLEETLTCCTSLLPPLRMEIPSLSVEETIAPGSPETHNKWKFTCSQLLSGSLLSRWERPGRQCDSNLYKHWSSAAPSLQPHGCGGGTAGTEAVVSPSLFPVKQRMRKSTETLPSELHCPPQLHTDTHTRLLLCTLCISDWAIHIFQRQQTFQSGKHFFT